MSKASEILESIVKADKVEVERKVGEWKFHFSFTLDLSKELQSHSKFKEDDFLSSDLAFDDITSYFSIEKRLRELLSSSNLPKDLRFLGGKFVGVDFYISEVDVSFNSENETVEDLVKQSKEVEVEFDVIAELSMLGTNEIEKILKDHLAKVL